MDFATIYAALVEDGHVTVPRNMRPRLTEFVKYCRERGTRLKGFIEEGNGIVIFLK